jgi:hypothetical protein
LDTPKLNAQQTVLIFKAMSQTLTTNLVMNYNNIIVQESFMRTIAFYIQSRQYALSAFSMFEKQIIVPRLASDYMIMFATITPLVNTQIPHEQSWSVKLTLIY